MHLRKKYILLFIYNFLKKLHEAAVSGDMDTIKDQEFRQQVYLAKDINGISAFHKAIANGQKEIAEHIMEKTDRACFNTIGEYPSSKFLCMKTHI